MKSKSSISSILAMLALSVSLSVVPVWAQDDDTNEDDSAIAPDYFDEDLFGTDSDDEETEAGEDGSSNDFFDSLIIGAPSEDEEGEASAINGEDISSLPTVATQQLDNTDYASYWDTAVFRALDKVTGRISVVDVPLETATRFERFEIVVHQCNKRPPEETPNTTAFVDVKENTLDNEVQNVFMGWMFASSPGLNAVEHPVYDVWLIDCKRVAPDTTAIAPALEDAAPEVTNQDATGFDDESENATSSDDDE